MRQREAMDRQQEAMDRQNALGIGALPLNYANTSAQMAGLLGAAGQYSGNAAQGAALGLGGVNSQFWANASEQFADKDYNKFDNWLGGLFGGGGSASSASNAGAGSLGFNIHAR